MNSLMRMSLMLNKIEDVCVLVRLLDAHVYQLRRFDWITHDGKRCKCALVRSYAFLSSVPVELIQFAHRMQSSPYLHTAADVSLLFRFPIPLFPWNSRYDFRSGCCYDSQNRLLSFSLYDIWHVKWSRAPDLQENPLLASSSASGSYKGRDMVQSATYHVSSHSTNVLSTSTPSAWIFVSLQKSRRTLQFQQKFVTQNKTKHKLATSTSASKENIYVITLRPSNILMYFLYLDSISTRMSANPKI